MKLLKRVLYACSGVLALAVIGHLAGPKLMAAVRGALVEIVQPSKPFFVEFNLVSGPNTYLVDGPVLNSGTLGLTSITLTNEDVNPQLVQVILPVLSGNSIYCSSETVIGGAYPQMSYWVGAKQTAHFTFPSPLVFPPYDGFSCVAVALQTTHTAPVVVAVNGFVN